MAAFSLCDLCLVDKTTEVLEDSGKLILKSFFSLNVNRIEAILTSQYHFNLTLSSQ